MNLIENEKVICLVKNTLNTMDTSLVEHGHRVAYMVEQILKYSGLYEGEELRNLVLACLIHDIGAYKTEDPQKILEFELDDATRHAIYGYLFLKNMSPLKEYADIIRYHHTDYNTVCEVCPKYAFIINLLQVCDRIDVLFLSDDIADAKKYFLENEADGFDRGIVDLFFKADEKCGFLERIYEKKDVPPIKSLREHPFDEKACHSFLFMMSCSIDFRSEFMVSHTITTTSIARKLAILCGLSEDEVEKVYFGALLHDIGKVKIPVTILDFPGKLSDSDMDIMRSHVVHSMDILDGCVSEDIRQIAVRHHEKLNGKGYPLGLDEKDLNTSERIVAIADILSALVGKRSYKEAFDSDRIKNILSSMAHNNELDNGIVSIACNKFDEIIEYITKETAPVIEMYDRVKKEFEEILLLGA